MWLSKIWHWSLKLLKKKKKWKKISQKKAWKRKASFFIYGPDRIVNRRMISLFLEYNFHFHPPHFLLFCLQTCWHFPSFRKPFPPKMSVRIWCASCHRPIRHNLIFVNPSPSLLGQSTHSHITHPSSDMSTSSSLIIIHLPKCINTHSQMCVRVYITCRYIQWIDNCPRLVCVYVCTLSDGS